MRAWATTESLNDSVGDHITCTLTWSQTSEMVSGPCSLTTSKIARVMDCACSGGAVSSIGAIFGFPFFAAHRAAVANIARWTARARRLTDLCLYY